MENHGYQNYILDLLKGYRTGEPIIAADLANKLGQVFGLPGDKALAAVGVCMNRIMNRQAINNLRRFEKGIYYLAKQTVFGETKIDNEKLIELKFMYPDIGYETGPLFLHKLGLTTLIPNERQIATNKAKDNTRMDKRFDIILKKPRVGIDAKNKRYLQFLDTLDMMDKTPVDAVDAYQILNRFVQQYYLQYDEMLALANRYYNNKVILKLADVADKGVQQT